MKWLAVWDISSNQNFGDIYIPEGFEPPVPQRVSQFSRLGAGVKSDPVIILNSQLIKIPSFSYDGKGEFQLKLSASTIVRWLQVF